MNTFQQNDSNFYAEFSQYINLNSCTNLIFFKTYYFFLGYLH